MTSELIGLPLNRAVERLNEMGAEFKIVENCDSLDGADTTLVTAQKKSDGVIVLVTSRFKCEI